MLWCEDIKNIVCNEQIYWNERYDDTILQFENIYMYMYEDIIKRVQLHAWFHNGKVKKKYKQEIDEIDHAYIQVKNCGSTSLQAIYKTMNEI